MAEQPFSASEMTAYDRDGYVRVPRLFDDEEMDLIRRSAKDDQQLQQRSFDRDDGTGANVRLSLWNHPGDTIYGMVARCRRMVDRAEQILEDEVYHYHSKMIMKQAHTGGAWAWHQDYGYWYENGVLLPHLVSVYVAVDRADRENGCLQVLRGSHHLGRVNHGLSGDQTGADMERVRAAQQRMDMVHCELDAGDALFFHCNLLHRSDANRSDRSRWALICCYNARHNDPYKDSHHPRYTPLEKVPDSAIKVAGIRRFNQDDSQVAWLDDRRDRGAARADRQR